MTTITIPNTSGDIKIGELTETKLDGNGVFDVLMKTISLHLEREFSQGRIRGTDYANVYTQALTDVLNQATNYSLAKAKLPLELQMQEAQILKVATDTAVATKQGALIEAQTTRELMEIELVRKELEIKEKQLLIMDKELALKEFELTQIKPRELDMLMAELDLKKAQLPLMLKDIELKTKQIELSEKELILKDKQIDVAISEVAIKQKQVELTEYELRNKLPAEVALIKVQGDLYNQKVATEKAQTDGSGIKDGSVIWYQNRLLGEQTKTYKRDAMQKFLKMLADAWAVRNNSDPDGNGANEQNKLLDVNVGEVVKEVANDLEITLPK